MFCTLPRQGGRRPRVSPAKQHWGPSDPPRSADSTCELDLPGRRDDQGGQRVEAPFTEDLRAEVLSVAGKIRRHRRNIEREIPVQQPVAKGRAWGQWADSSQAT